MTDRVDPAGGEAFAPRSGWVAPEVAAEFPGLRVAWVTVAGGARGSPPALRGRLRSLSNQYRGGGVVSMRSRPIPQAYRAFFRQIGLDPDVQRIPSERVAVDRLVHGEFRSVGMVSDACLVALIETGVPVWALDAGLVDPAGLGIRATTAEDAATAPDISVPAGSLVVADGRRPQAVLFSDPPPARGVGQRTRQVLIFTLAVDGVPEIHVEEALWMVFDLLSEGE